LGPKIFGDFWNGVNSDSIKFVFGDDIFNPANQVATYIAVRVLCEIWQVSKTTVLNLSLVVPVCNLAITVVVSGLVEGIDGAVVSSNWTNVVCYDINHHPDVTSVAGRNKIDEVLL